MSVRDILVPMLRERFPDRGLQLGSAPGPIAVFPAAHREVGAASVASSGDDSGVDVAVGGVARDSFFNPYEDEQGTVAAAQGIAQNVVRFLEELFADRLLMWRSDDGATLGWRERGEAGHTAPLVVDDRVYHTYIWTRPLGTWQATPTILARGRIVDDREYEIMVQRATDDGPDRLPPGQRDLARDLVAEYEREMRAQRSAEGGPG
jgi:hypothetical protein